MPKPKIRCWCGLHIRTDQLHYPNNDPENGPAHRPADPCPACGSEPHEDDCFPLCCCYVPSPQIHVGDLPHERIAICRKCGLEVDVPALTLEFAS
jgi:hypothetical protein